MSLPHIERKVTVGSEEIVLDSKKLEFNEATLSKFQDELGVYYDYLGAKLTDLEYIRDRYDAKMDQIFAEKYAEYKEAGDTAVLSESKAKSDVVYQETKQKYLGAKHKVRQLQQHLRAWDKAHENAQNRGHTLRKEMDKLRTQQLESEVSRIVEGS